MKDYYKILKVEEQSSEEDIKKSYRTLSKEYHPDVNPNGEAQFKDIADKIVKVQRDRNDCPLEKVEMMKKNTHLLMSFLQLI